MENATKALLIAAAVLVAILIISLGVGVFTSASEQMGNMDLSEYQKQEINSKFSGYHGKNMTAEELNTFVERVFHYNNAQKDTSTCIEVYVTGRNGSLLIEKDNNMTQLPDKITSGTYVINCIYTNGVITRIDAM